MSQPESFQKLLKRFRKQQRLRQSKRICQIRELWVTTVGEELAKVTRLVYLRKGVLKIEVENSVLLSELEFKKEELLQTIQKNFPQVQDLYFSLGGF